MFVGYDQEFIALFVADSTIDRHRVIAPVGYHYKLISPGPESRLQRSVRHQETVGLRAPNKIDYRRTCFQLHQGDRGGGIVQLGQDFVVLVHVGLARVGPAIAFALVRRGTEAVCHPNDAVLPHVVRQCPVTVVVTAVEDGGVGDQNGTIHPDDGIPRVHRVEDGLNAQFAAVIAKFIFEFGDGQLFLATQQQYQPQQWQGPIHSWNSQERLGRKGNMPTAVTSEGDREWSQK